MDELSQTAVCDGVFMSSMPVELEFSKGLVALL